MIHLAQRVFLFPQHDVSSVKSQANPDIPVCLLISQPAYSHLQLLLSLHAALQPTFTPDLSVSYFISCLHVHAGLRGVITLIFGLMWS